MTRLVTVLLIASCGPTASPHLERRSSDFQSNCNSSADCAHDVDGCRYCIAAHCSCTLPAEPTVPVDGGIDAK